MIAEKRIIYNRNFTIQQNDEITKLLDVYLSTTGKTKAGRWIRFVLRVLPVKWIIFYLKLKNNHYI